ncbi:MAG TPA: alpha/beta fold hydrolase, partial [Acetobacteraceae bacterium]|nr:alpha/beta fold hydrolase [Acetobacteraceae bacterium]
MRSERCQFAGYNGQSLAARLDLPDAAPLAAALFAHCFTCGKDVVAASRIASNLAAHGIATLRFDFTGLGSSDGEFANTNFSTNLQDLLAAAEAMRARAMAPALLIGHSLGGAAVLAAAASIPEARAVVTIGAPFDPDHVLRLITAQLPEIESRGEAAVSLGGRPFTIKRQFVEDLRAQNPESSIGHLGKALLVMHAPTDAIVGIDNARQIFDAARHPKSFVALPDASHLLDNRADAEYAAAVLAAWSSRYIGGAPALGQAPADDADVVVAETGNGKLQQRITAGPHQLLADEPVPEGGLGTGPNPYDLLLAALGACTSMTLRVYADRKGFPLTRVRVALSHRKIYAQDCADCETREGRVDEI